MASCRYRPGDGCCGHPPRLAGYLAAHPEVTTLQFTGADPLIMGAAALGRYIEPLLQARDPHLADRQFFAPFDADAAWLTDLQPITAARP